MATYKIIYDRKHKVYDPKTQKVLSNEPALVQIRVTHNRKPRFFSTEVMVAPKDWDFRQDRVKGSHARYVDYNLKIKQALNSLEDQVLAMEQAGKPIELDRLSLKVAERPPTFELFWREQLMALEESEQITPRQAEQLQDGLNMLRRFQERTAYDELTAEWVEAYDLIKAWTVCPYCGKQEDDPGALRSHMGKCKHNDGSKRPRTLLPEHMKENMS